MNFNNSITLDTYSNNANKQFGDMQSRLAEIETSFQPKMNGKTNGGLVGTLVGTFAWLAIFVVGALYVRNMVNATLLIIAMAIIGGLFLFMIIDNIMDFSYYGKLASYKNSVSQLQNRVSIGLNSIKSNHDTFLRSKTNGWNYNLNAAPSIPDEANSIESTVANMESLKKGFINGAKNVFFYASVVAFAVVGGLALFPVCESIMTIAGADLSSDLTDVLSYIALAISVIGTIILSKLIWSKTDCAVNNVTLFSILLGPIALLTLIALGTLIVYLAIGMFYVLVIVAAIAIVFACVCGG